MAASITLAGEKLIAQKQADNLPLTVARFVLANVPGLNVSGPVNRAGVKPPAAQIVYTANITQQGYVNPNQVVYSLLMGTDIGDFDWNWIGLETSDDVLLSVAYVPLQQKRKNVLPDQIGNNVTRNFLVVFDGAQQLTGIKIDASTWQHDFTVRLKGIDERERLSNRDVFGRACFFDSGLKLEKVGSTYQLKAGVAYVEGIRLESTAVLPVFVPSVPNKAWLDVSLQRDHSDVVGTFQVVFGMDKVDYNDGAGARHYLVPLADLPTSSLITDLRSVEPIITELIKHLAARVGDYPNLRARATTKDDVKLGQIPNAISSDPTSNSDQVLATTKMVVAVRQLLEVLVDTKLNKNGGNVTGTINTTQSIVLNNGSNDSPEVRWATTLRTVFADVYNHTFRIFSTGVPDPLNLDLANQRAYLFGREPWDTGNFNPALKADLAGAAFTGPVRVPSLPATTKDQQAANTAFVHSVVAALVDSSPAALDTLKKLATALGNDPNFATSMTNALAGKLSTSGGTVAGQLYSRKADAQLGVWGSAGLVLDSDLHPAITFHASSRGVARMLGLQTDNELYLGGSDPGQPQYKLYHSGNFNPAGKANVATTLGGYGITDAYTASQSDGRFVRLAGENGYTAFSLGQVPSLAAAGAYTQGHAPLAVTNGNNPAAAAVITFHRGGSYGTFFGLDTDNQFAFGGWSAGNARYRFWTEANRPKNTASVEVNGWHKDADTGRIEQWGRVTLVSPNAVGAVAEAGIYFPMSFPAAFHSVTFGIEAVGETSEIAENLVGFHSTGLGAMTVRVQRVAGSNPSNTPITIHYRVTGK
ncbi:phage tail protein [Pseudomonas syringae]|uniref:phage tail protein n=1 Tax=Pseudomonas syringae TaxID=317 RepID=UPI000E32C226|nr:phage tail protein [Pseudomonas syringae]